MLKFIKQRIIVIAGVLCLSLGTAHAQSVEVTEIIPAPVIIESPQVVERIIETPPTVVERIVERPTIVERREVVEVPVPVLPPPVIVPGVLPGRYRALYPYAPAVPVYTAPVPAYPIPGPVFYESRYPTYYAPPRRWMP